jgi:glycosyltransferase involved in cell wall biosynthesis
MTAISRDAFTARDGSGRPLDIWLITVGEPLPLPGETARLWRTGILAQLLVDRGHCVTWWTSTINHFRKEYFATSSCARALSDRFELQFLHGELYRRNITLARLRNHRQIALEFRQLSRQRRRPDIILCSYPTIELSAEAVAFGNAYDVPVLLDIRDLWPDEIEARLPRLLAPALRLLLRSMYRQADYALRNAAGFVAVSEHYLRWALLHAGRDLRATDRIFTHAYPAPSARPSDDAMAAFRRELGVGPDQHIACFIGTFVGSIDLHTVIAAARRVVDRTDLVFVLAGSGDQDAVLRAEARSLDNVIFTGWLDRDRLAALANTAWIGLGAYKRGALVSLTNKVFEYMAFGLPIVSSLPGEAQALLERLDCGVFYEPGSAQSLESVLRRLLDQPQLHDAMARHAAQAFHHEFCADVVYPTFAAHLEGIAAERAPTPGN